MTPQSETYIHRRATLIPGPLHAEKYGHVFEAYWTYLLSYRDQQSLAEYDVWVTDATIAFPIMRVGVEGGFPIAVSELQDDPICTLIRMAHELLKGS